MEMKIGKMITAVSAIVILLLVAGCTQDQERLAAAGVVAAGAAAAAYHEDGSHKDNYYHYGQDYGEGRNYDYRDGVRDGCATSRTAREKLDRYRWNNNDDYRSGWVAGKRQCRNM